jgi:hypothetical protein
MLKHKWANRIVSCLVCWMCHSRMGPNHFTLRGRRCAASAGPRTRSATSEKCPSRRSPSPRRFWCVLRGGTLAHALHHDYKTVLGPWVKFTSAETLEKAFKYLGADDDQMAAHRNQMDRCGQGSSHIRLLPNMKNLLRIDWNKL